MWFEWTLRAVIDYSTLHLYIFFQISFSIDLSEWDWKNKKMIAIKDLKDQKALKCQKTSFVTYATQMVLLDEEKNWLQ